MCIRHAGQVLTSDRLVAGASRIEVVTSDGTVQTAGVIGRDPVSDLALLSIDGALDAADLAAPDHSASASRCTPSAPTHRDRHG